MPQKTTKQTTTTKKNTKKSDNKEKTTVKKTKKPAEPKETEKKVVIKRRKKDLTPTKASATAIISQANRAKKQALIKKLSEEKISQTREVERKPSSSKVPLWVRLLFWWSLLWFCIAFYLAIIHPQLESKNVAIQVDDNFYWSSDMQEWNTVWNVDLSNITSEDNNTEENKTAEKTEIIADPQNAEELIQSYFAYMSDWDFDNSFALFDEKTQNDKNIRDHFTAFRMSPFFGWIDGNTIIPQNIQKTTETYKWKEVYTFDISYILSSTQEQYDETWKFATSENEWKPRILMIYCVSNGCWRHPIFWPEDFGLMR